MPRSNFRPLRRLAREVREAANRSRDITPMMRAIGRDMLREARTRFDAGIDPGGKRWPPSEAARREGRQTLIKTKRLRNSIRYRSGRDFAETFTNVEYGQYHQEGTRRLPRRQFLGTSTSDELRYVRAVSRYVLTGKIKVR